MLLVAAAGVVGGFVSTLASNGSAVTLPALESLGLPEHVANGTNRLSVVALGLVGAARFYRRRLLDWRKGAWISLFIALGTLLPRAHPGAAGGRSDALVRGGGAGG